MELASSKPSWSQVYLPFSPTLVNLHAFHQVLVFVCIKSVLISHVKPEERFLIRRIGPKEFRIYWCIARCGYQGNHKDEFKFEKDLFCSITEKKPKFKSTKDTHADEENLTIVGSFSTNKGVRLS